LIVNALRFTMESWHMKKRMLTAKLKYSSFRAAAIAVFAAVGVCAAAPDPNFHCYLLFGQSNMAGGGAIGDITSDCDTTPRVKVLAFCDCSGSSPDCSRQINRTHDTWYTAFPPIHICSEGISPGDWFARTMLDSIRSDISIGVIPCALSGQSIDVFKKGGSGFTIPTWAHPTIGNGSPYGWMLERCKIAQQTGVIKGLLFHQGESDNGAATWIARVSAVFDNLKKDLGLDTKLPVVVGELRQDNVTPLPCCAGHNRLVDSLAKVYPACAVASSKDLNGNGKDTWHFTAAGMRELGKRYAKALLSLAGNDFIPRKGSVSLRERTVSLAATRSWTGHVKIYSIDGRFQAMLNGTNRGKAWSAALPEAVYLVVRKPGDRARLMMAHSN
jgi:hypothetical protein